jgi:hypothetical protein
MEHWKTAVAVVASLFAAFSGFLLNMQPPEQAANGFAVGFASFIATIIFLVVSVLAKKRLRDRLRMFFLAAAMALTVVAVMAGLSYQQKLVVTTFYYPDETGSRYIKGKDLTPRAQKIQASSSRTEAQLVADFGGIPNRELVWSRASLDEAKVALSNSYMLFVITLCAAVFFLVQGALAGRGQ